MENDLNSIYRLALKLLLGHIAQDELESVVRNQRLQAFRAKIEGADLPVSSQLISHEVPADEAVRAGDEDT